MILRVCLFYFATLFATSTYGQNATNNDRFSVPYDWSHHHLIFSEPTLEKASEIWKEPRYWHQYYRRNVAKLDRDHGKNGKHEREESEDRDESRGDRNERGDRSGNNASAPSLHRDWSMDMGSGATVGERTFPAKFPFTTTSASCGNDFVVYNTGLAGSATQAGIVAYDNLYSGCGGTVPSVYWAYNVGIFPAMSSVVLSGDGSQVAFVVNNGSFGATLRLLKWKPNDGSVTSPSTPTNIFNASLYRACAAPCMLLMDISGGTHSPATFSTPFYAYGTDVLYVADDEGYVYKISGAFNGTPSVGPALANVGGAEPLTGPVFDSVSGNIFVGGRTSGKLFAISPAGTVTASAQIGTAAGHGVGDAPIVDSGAGRVYAFVAQDLGTGAGVFQFPTNFAAGAPGTEAVLGSPNTSVSGAFAGTFDDAYYTSSNATGYLYACGYSGADPTLFRVAVNSGVMGSVQQGPKLGTSTSCSPVTENLSGTIDWIFLSVQGAGSSSACSGGGCVLSFMVTQWKPNTSYPDNSEVLDSNFNVQFQFNFPGGTSGAGAPIWGTTFGQETPDGTALWDNQGALANITTAWQASHAYLANDLIMDANGFIQIVLGAGTSGGSQPGWSDAPQSSTLDGGVIWVAIGPAPGFALPSTGGASAIIIDNSVGSGTLAGASQVYYSPLGNQPCAGNGTTGSGSGGCAVQASQAGLQ